MLLVLQSVHQTPPVEQFYTLQTLVGKVVHPYLCMVHRSRPGGRSKHVLDMETVCKFKLIWNTPILKLALLPDLFSVCNLI